MNDQTSAALERALELSRIILAAADRGEGDTVSCVDAERLQLLRSARASAMKFDRSQRAMLEQIAMLNHESIGFLERHRDSKGRQMEEAAAGRRAVKAYAHIRRLR